MPLKKKLFHCEVVQTQEKAAQGDCGVCILGATQNPAGHDSEL